MVAATRICREGTSACFNPSLPMGKSGAMKKRIIILGSVVFAVLALWSIAWFVLAGVVRQNIEAQALADGVTAPRLTCGTLNVSGFPFRMDADCQTAQIELNDVILDVAGIRATMVVERPTMVIASAKGPLSINDTFTGTRNQVVWSTLETSLRLDNWRIARFSVSGKDMVWSDTLFGDTVIAQSPLVELHLFDIPEQHDADKHLAALSSYIRTQSLSYPALTLSDTAADIQLELSGLPDDIRAWGDPMLLPALQQAGGQLKIVAIHATDATSTLDADGQLGLDPQGLVEGQIAITSTGVAERVGPLLQEPWRTLVLGTPAADGSHGNLLNFKAGALFSGLIPVAAIPPLF